MQANKEVTGKSVYTDAIHINYVLGKAYYYAEDYNKSEELLKNALKAYGEMNEILK